MRTGEEWRAGMQLLSAAPYVRTVSFHGCDLAAAESNHVAEALCRLNVLQVVSLMGCAVDGERVASLIGPALQTLPAFRDDFAPEPETEDEDIEGFELRPEHRVERLRLDMELPPELNLAGTSMDSCGFHRFATSLGAPLRGLCVLHLSTTRVDDDCLVAVAGACPQLRELHAHHTKVELACATPFIAALPQLRLLNCDSSRVCGKGAGRILEAMRARLARRSQVKLEVWMRGMPVSSSWMALLHFCASKGLHLGMYRVKHDLQEQTRRSERHGVKLHPEVQVELMFNAAEKATVIHTGVVCTKTSLQLAEEAVLELNLVAVRDARGVHDAVTMRLRRAYRAALSEQSSRGALDDKQYRVGMLFLRRVHKYTGAVTESQVRAASANRCLEPCSSARSPRRARAGAQRAARAARPRDAAVPRGGRDAELRGTRALKPPRGGRGGARCNAA